VAHKIKTSAEPRIAIVHDRLNVRGGGERLLEEIATLYPRAPIYTLIYDPILFNGSPIAKHQIHTSLINHLPFATSHHRFYIPLMPFAIEQFDLHDYDVILSSSAAFAHGVLSRPDQLHISYIHSPMRYAWHQYQEHLGRIGYASFLLKPFLANLRRWDRVAGQRANSMLTNSAWTARLIHRAFEREAKVIYPPVHTEKFAAGERRKDYYLTVSRLVPYKRVDLIVRAFASLGHPLIVVGDGPEYKKLLSLKSPNIKILRRQTEAQLAKLMEEAKAFIYAAQEDFGIAAVEAQAAGCPVIAYASGGLLETVVDRETGLFYKEQNVTSLVEAVKKFENGEVHFSSKVISRNAQRFAVEHFRKAFAGYVSHQWEEFNSRKLGK